MLRIPEEQKERQGENAFKLSSAAKGSKLLAKYELIRTSRSSQGERKIATYALSSELALHTHRSRNQNRESRLFVATQQNSVEKVFMRTNPEKKINLCILKMQDKQELIDRLKQISTRSSARSQENPLKKYKEEDFMFKGQVKVVEYEGKLQIVKAFLPAQNQFVSLIPVQNNEQLHFVHPNILPVLGELYLSSHKYIVSNHYEEDNTLFDLLQDFGALPEKLVARYLRQILNGIQHLHYHKKGHNRLSLGSVLYDKDGHLFINLVKSSTRPLSEGEKRQGVHCYPPQLFFKSKSLKVDIWSIGCIALQLLCGKNIGRSPLHPYNPTYQQQMSKHELTLLENMRQLHPDMPRDEKRQSVCLSAPALKFIGDCLQLRSELRPTAEALLSHEFLE